MTSLSEERISAIEGSNIDVILDKVEYDLNKYEKIQRKLSCHKLSLKKPFFGALFFSNPMRAQLKAQSEQLAIQRRRISETVRVDLDSNQEDRIRALAEQIAISTEQTYSQALADLRGAAVAMGSLGISAQQAGRALRDLGRAL